MAGDVNGDGSVDLVGAAGDASLRLLTGDGTGHFADGGVVASILTTTPMFFARLVDWDADGNLDLYINGKLQGTYSSVFWSFHWIFRGRGNGSFATLLDKYDDSGGFDKRLTLETGDHDNDGNLDWVTSFWNSTSVRITHTDGAGGVTGTQIQFAGQWGVQDLTMGDVNGDGASDLVIPFHDLYQFPDPDAMTVVDNGGTVQKWLTGTPVWRSTIGDFHGDGRAEVLAFGDNDRMLVNQGGGAFAGPTSFSFNGEFTAVADVNGDGRADLVGYTDTGTTVAALNATPPPLAAKAWVGDVEPWGAPVASVPAPVVKLRGTGLASVQGAAVGGQTYGASSLTLSSDGNTLALTLVPPPQAGVADVVLITGAGPSWPVKFPLCRADAPVLLVVPPKPLAGQAVVLYFAGPTPGDVPLALTSACLTPLPFPPYAVFDIGGCGDAHFLPAPAPMDASGLTSLPVVFPPSLSGTLLHVQFCDVDLAALAAGTFPLAVSNVLTLRFP
jgi:hypothetical protein